MLECLQPFRSDSWVTPSNNRSFAARVNSFFQKKRLVCFFLRTGNFAALSDIGNAEYARGAIVLP